VTIGSPITYPNNFHSTPTQPPPPPGEGGPGGPGRPQGFFEITVSRRQILRFKKSVFEINNFFPINLVPVNEVEWVGTVSKGGQPKSQKTFFEQIFTTKSLGSPFFL
jgi:hypothetical protein